MAQEAAILASLMPRLDDVQIQLLTEESDFTQQELWFMAIQQLFKGRRLVERSDSELQRISVEEWRRTYNLLARVADYKSPFTPDVVNNKLAVELLLEAGYNPAAGESSALAWAVRNNSTEVVALLLEDGRADPRADASYALRTAAEEGNVQIVWMLLRDKRADPTADDNYAIKVAVERGHTEVVRLLLEDGRADPHVDNDYPIRAARGEKHFDIVELLREYD